VAMSTELRSTGIRILGDMPWGSHVCLYYGDSEDLLDAIVPYFAAGLVAGERCVWMPSEPRMEEEALRRLRGAAPDLERHLAEGRLEFISADDWYRPAGHFDVAAVMRQWEAQYARVDAEGHAGLRGSGDLGWLRREDWESFDRYEGELHTFLRARRIMVLCTYPLATSRATDVFDTARTHHLAVAHRSGRWEMIETPALKRTKEEIQRLNEELGRQIAERTTELARTAAKLARAKRVARERALRARFAAVLEERTRLSREIHDTLLQGATGIALQLRAALPHLSGAPAAALDTLREIVELAEKTIRDARRAVWDMRVVAVVQRGLSQALEEEVRRIAAGMAVRFAITGVQRTLLPSVEDVVFRVAAEAVTNVVKHARARTVSVTLDYEPHAVRLTIEDDGRGLDRESAFRASGGQWGVLGMRERAERVGASLTIRTRPGEGTVVDLFVPDTRAAGPAATVPARASARFD
jgi:signal transduction histidine kinase